MLGGLAVYISLVKVSRFQHVHVLSSSTRTRLFLNGATDPHDHVEFALVNTSFGMQHANSSGLQRGHSRLSGGTSGCHSRYMVIGEEVDTKCDVSEGRKN
jgi:hypothetical protein